MTTAHTQPSHSHIELYSFQQHRRFHPHQFPMPTLSTHLYNIFISLPLHLLLYPCLHHRCSIYEETFLNSQPWNLTKKPPNPLPTHKRPTKTHTPPPSTQNSPLLRLPPELRLQILSHLIAGNTYKPIVPPPYQPIRLDRSADPAPWYIKWGPTNLLLTCRQIYVEALEILYGDNTFVIEEPKVLVRLYQGGFSYKCFRMIRRLDVGDGAGRCDCESFPLCVFEWIGLDWMAGGFGSLKIIGAMSLIDWGNACDFWGRGLG